MALPKGKEDSLKQDLKKEESVIKKHTGIVGMGTVTSGNIVKE